MVVNINNPNYKGGIIFDGRYWKVRMPEHPFGNGYVYLHRLVYEQCNNCILLPYADCHHKDDNPHNNLIDNLEPCYRGQHNAKRIDKHHTEELKKKISQRMKGKRYTLGKHWKWHKT